MGRRVALRITIVGTLLLTVSGAGLAEATTQSRPVAVVSLGDSYIAGNAGRWLGNSPDGAGDRRGTDRAFVAAPEPHYDPTLVYGDTVNGCWRSDVAEITHVRFPPGIRTFNLACSGATTSSLPEQNAELAEVARTHRVRAIVLSVGGNDIGFSGTVLACVLAFLGGSDPCNSAQQGNVDLLLPDMRAGVARAIDDIRATMTAAGYRNGAYRLILQSYPAPLPRAADMRYPEATDRAAIGHCPFYDADVEWGHTSLIPQLADTLRAVAAERRVQFLDVRDAFRGHELCSDTARQPETAPQASTSEWMRFIDLDQPPQGSVLESLHPNAYGQQALGRCLRLTLLVFRDVSCHGVPGLPPSAVYLRPLR